MQNYSIASGDCLYSIVSSKYGDKIKSEDDMWKAIDSIAELNNISDPNLIYAGDTIKLPDYDSIFSQKTSNEEQTTSNKDDKVDQEDFDNWMKTGVSKYNGDDEYDVEDFEILKTDISYQDQAFVEPYKDAVSSLADSSVKSYDNDDDGFINYQEYVKKEVNDYNDNFNENIQLDDSGNVTNANPAFNQFFFDNFNMLDANKDGKLGKAEIASLYAALDGYDSKDGSVDGKIKFNSMSVDYADSDFQKLYTGAMNLFKDDDN